MGSQVRSKGKQGLKANMVGGSVGQELLGYWRCDSRAEVVIPPVTKKLFFFSFESLSVMK